MKLMLTDNEVQPDLYIDVTLLDQQVLGTSMRYFDKNGYELNDTEQLYYTAAGINMQEPHLNHIANHVSWFVDVEDSQLGATLDHSVLVQRWAYSGYARQQLVFLSQTPGEFPPLNKLLSIKPKWGFDLSLDYVYTGGATELFHVEYDSLDYDTACEQQHLLAELVMRTDWQWGGEQIMKKRSEWQHLNSDVQSDWKVRYFGWHRAFDNRKILD